MTKRRREDRVRASVPVRVWGLDVKGKPFSQEAVTLDITRTGVRVGGLRCILQLGDVVGLQHGNEKSRYRVVWVGRHGGPQQGQVGLHCVEPGKYIWGAPLSRLSQPDPPVAPSLRVSQDVPDAASLKTPHADRREFSRFTCSGSIQILNTDAGFPMGATVSDISMQGCYVETVQPLPSNAKVDAVLSLLGTEIRFQAQVRGSHPGVGMGLLFTILSAEDDERLRRVIAELKSRQKRLLGPTVQSKPAHKPSEEIAQPLDDVSALLAAADPNLDPRISAEIHRAARYAQDVLRQLRAHVAQGSTAEPYALLEQLESYRIRLITELLLELSLDIDSQAIQVGTTGLTQLIAAFSRVHARLLTMAGTQNGAGALPYSGLASAKPHS